MSEHEPPPAPRRWTFEETGEVRLPRRGEYYMAVGDGISFAAYDYSSDSYPILRLVESPAPTLRDGLVKAYTPSETGGLDHMAPKPKRYTVEVRVPAKGDSYLLGGREIPCTGECYTDPQPVIVGEELDLEAAEKYWTERQRSDDGNIALSEADFHIRLEESRGVLAILREARRGRAARKALGEMLTQADLCGWPDELMAPWKAALCGKETT